MKKRFVTTLISLIACIACAVGLAACGDDADPVAGKTYEFEKVEITKGAEGAVKEEAEAQLNLLYAGSEIVFGDDSEFTMSVMGQTQTGTYEQSGANLTLTVQGASQTANVKDNYVTASIDDSGIAATLYYKAKTATGGTDEGGNQGGNEGNISSGVLNVSGKTFVFSDMTASFDDSVNEETQKQINETITQMKTAYNGSTIAFNENSGFTMSVMGQSVSGAYTQNGKNLVLTANNHPQDFILNGNEITATHTEGGVTQTMYYLLQE